MLALALAAIGMFALGFPFHFQDGGTRRASTPASNSLPPEPEFLDESVTAAARTESADTIVGKSVIQIPPKEGARNDARSTRLPAGSTVTVPKARSISAANRGNPAAAELVSAAGTNDRPSTVDQSVRRAQVPKAADQPQLDDLPTPDLPPAIRDDDEERRKQALARFIDEIDVDRFDPTKIFELYVGLPRLIRFKFQPARIQLGDDQLTSGTFITPTEYSIVGKRLGSSVMNIWFTDDPATPEDESQRVHSYLLRVVSNPELRRILEKRYKEIEDEINRVFPDSRVQLTLVGNKLVVSGECRDIQEATYILNVIRSNVLPANQLGIGGGYGGGAGAAGDIATSVATTGGAAGGAAGGFAAGTPGVLNAGLFGGDFIVNLLRIPGEQQIMLRVVVAEVNRSAVRSIGMNFAIQNGSGKIVASNTTGGILLNGVNGAGNTSFIGGIGTGSNNITASLDNGQVFLAFSAMRTLGYARSLAEPNIVALNGQPATFQAGGEFPVPVISGFTFAGLQGVAFVPYGVIVQFTPLITDRDRVRLAVRAIVSTRDTSTQTSIAGANVPGLQTRNFATVVELRQGQTLAVAGLIQNNLVREFIPRPRHRRHALHRQLRLVLNDFARRAGAGHARHPGAGAPAR